MPSSSFTQYHNASGKRCNRKSCNVPGCKSPARRREYCLYARCKLSMSFRTAAAVTVSPARRASRICRRRGCNCRLCRCVRSFHRCNESFCGVPAALLVRPMRTDTSPGSVTTNNSSVPKRLRISTRSMAIMLLPVINSNLPSVITAESTPILSECSKGTRKMRLPSRVWSAISPCMRHSPFPAGLHPPTRSAAKAHIV